LQLGYYTEFLLEKHKTMKLTKSFIKDL